MTPAPVPPIEAWILSADFPGDLRLSMDVTPTWQERALLVD